MSDEKNKCIYCNKSYSTKTNLSKHNKICKLNPDYKSTETLKYELYHLNNLLIDKDKLLEQKDEEIRIQKNIIDRYVKNDDKISNQINTTNNTLNNNITINTTQSLKDIISSLEPINFEEMKKQFENKLSNKYIDKGIEGIAHFISEIPCQNKFITTDYSRKIVTYKTDNQIVVDPKANILLNTAIKQNADTIIDRAEDRYQYWNQQIKDARDDDVEPDKTDIKNRNRTKNLKTIASKAKNDVPIDIEDAANVIILKGMENKNYVNAIE